MESPVPFVVLCVDDDHTSLTVRRLLLSIAGYTVLTATTAESALKLFVCNRVDLVITDHSLADYTGAELTVQLKQLKPEVPVVVLSAWIEPLPGYDRADLLLNKGMTPEEFLAEIKGLLSTKPRAGNTYN